MIQTEHLKKILEVLEKENCFVSKIEIANQDILIRNLKKYEAKILNLKQSNKFIFHIEVFDKVEKR